MPTPYCVDDFEGKVDSLYRLVILGARRANQISKTESHGFGAARARKTTITSMEEVLAGKVGYFTSKEEEEDYLD